MNAQIALKTFVQLGPRQAAWYALYKFGLRTGHYRRVTPPVRSSWSGPIRPLIAPSQGRAGLAAVLDITARVRLMSEAEEICGGEVRLFGGPPVVLRLAPPVPPLHWTEYENGQVPWGAEDVKDIWEPARFGWVFTLGRAYLLSAEERFAEAFWRQFEAFDAANPPNEGPNWASAQEVALRLLALLFASEFFAHGPSGDLPCATPARKARLAASAAEHATRIPPTLPYARAQHNNHLLSEALGLYAAGLCLPGHPEAPRWLDLGWRELNDGLCAQIAADGTYAQHSTSYHRVMLHLALLADSLARSEGRAWPPATQQALSAAAQWLFERIDPLSGHVSNLGSNDGANILPLSPGDIADYRSVVRASCLAFRGEAVLTPGPWDELSFWLGIPVSQPPASAGNAPSSTPRITDHAFLALGDKSHSWAALRAVRFTSRPSHSDQLHVEIWENGRSLTLDPGTYRYAAPPPWDNALARTFVHNTVTIDASDPMTRAGKFLWLDWAQARAFPTPQGILGAEHDGYRRLGLIHRRTLQQLPAGWEIRDEIIPIQKPRSTSEPELHLFTLHWLLPDWPFQVNGRTVALSDPSGMDFAFSLSLEGHAEGEESAPPLLHLIRAGESLLGARTLSPLLGWHSPTYSVRKPALSVVLSLRAPAPVRFVSHFTLAEEMRPGD